MESSQFVASIHRDYLPFVALASDAELAQFVRAQIALSDGAEAPDLEGMAKALLDAHTALVERLEESRRKKSEAGRRGGNPSLKQPEAEVKQCLSTDKAPLKPDTVTVSVSDTVSSPCPPDARAQEVGAVISAYLDKVNPSASQNSLDELRAFMDVLPPSVVMRAIEIAIDEKKASFSYIRGILRRWASSGVTCIADIGKLDERWASANDRQGGGNRNADAGGNSGRTPQYGTIL